MPCVLVLSRLLGDGAGIGVCVSNEGLVLRGTIKEALLLRFGDGSLTTEVMLRRTGLSFRGDDVLVEVIEDVMLVR